MFYWKYLQISKENTCDFRPCFSKFSGIFSEQPKASKGKCYVKKVFLVADRAVRSRCMGWVSCALPSTIMSCKCLCPRTTVSKTPSWLRLGISGMAVLGNCRWSIYVLPKLVHQTVLVPFTAVDKVCFYRTYPYCWALAYPLKLMTELLGTTCTYWTI